MGFDLTFTLRDLGDALKVMGLGMGGIFIALIVLYLISLLLLKLFPDKPKHDKDKRKGM